MHVKNKMKKLNNFLILQELKLNKLNYHKITAANQKRIKVRELTINFLAKFLIIIAIFIKQAYPICG
jgi:hypothetical protein